jgi:hypothetical protein
MLGKQCTTELQPQLPHHSYVNMPAYGQAGSFGFEIVSQKGQTSLALSCFSLLSTGITGVCYYSQ